MLDSEMLKSKLDTLTRQKEQLTAQYNYILGAEATIKELLKECENEAKKDKSAPANNEKD